MTMAVLSMTLPGYMRDKTVSAIRDLINEGINPTHNAIVAAVAKHIENRVDTTSVPGVKDTIARLRLAQISADGIDPEISRLVDRALASLVFDREIFDMPTESGADQRFLLNLAHVPLSC